ncbi:MAG: class I SAM-dependent methyltransferase [Thermomicrobiales bacterium]
MTDPIDPKQVVARGYDQIAERYLVWGAAGIRLRERDRYTTVLLDALPIGAAVLELGCGAGIPTTQRLAERFAMTGIDISARQIALARRNVPNATFIHADMTGLDFPPDTFDAICAFYALGHVPREEHAALLRQIARWLRPDGLFVASFSNDDSAGDIEDDWLGAPMYFSGYDAETNERLVRDAGFDIVTTRPETAEEFGRPTTFVWIVARKPRTTNEGSNE